MLSIKVEETDLFNELTEEFIYVKPITLNLEHSLISLQKWEAKWKKPFLSTKRTAEEMLDYVKCMTMNPSVDENVYLALTSSQIDSIADYINDEKTATTFYSSEKHKGNKREIITAEIIYYDMIALNIPPEYRKWHLNQLLTLIHVCSIKSDPNNKMSKTQTAIQNSKLNKMRRKALNSKG